MYHGCPQMWEKNEVEYKSLLKSQQAEKSCRITKVSVLCTILRKLGKGLAPSRRYMAKIHDTWKKVVLKF